MGKRSLRRRIGSLERRIAEHRAKLKEEMACHVPNLDVIRHWLAEVRAFQESVDRARKRLGER